jgi:hypothetical protein
VPPRPEEERRRQLRRDYKHDDRTVWLASLPLDESAHAELLDHLDQELGAHPCDHTLRLTEKWLAAKDLDVAAVVERYELMGAGCDCELLANLDPETHV